MKYFKIIALLIFSSAISFYSCNNKTEETKKETPKPQPLQVFEEPSASNNSSGVWHYTCSKGCTGGAAAAGNCATCGDALAHNQAYHNTKLPTPPTTPTAKPAEPSQNAAGIWHYTCGNGCTGGSGTTGSCASCGGTLAHNQVYHQ